MTAEPLGKEHRAACAQPGFGEAKHRPESHSSAGTAEATSSSVRDRATRDQRGKRDRQEAEPESHPRGMLRGERAALGRWADVGCHPEDPSRGGHNATSPGAHGEQPGAERQAEPNCPRAGV